MYIYMYIYIYIYTYLYSCLFICLFVYFSLYMMILMPKLNFIYVTVRVSNQGFSQIPNTFRESVKFLFHSRIRSLNVYGYD